MIGHEELMRYLDGELPAERERAVEEALRESTELRRELTLFRAMKTDLEEIGAGMRTERTVWAEVNRRLTRPVAWVLFLTGALVWIAFGTYTYLTGADALWEKLAASAVVVGLIMLFASAALDRYTDLQTDPYRNIER